MLTPDGKPLAVTKAPPEQPLNIGGVSIILLEVNILGS